eukprot:5996865-Lingulodinium_polyedra.AAC.1
MVAPAAASKPPSAPEPPSQVASAGVPAPKQPRLQEAPSPTGISAPLGNARRGRGTRRLQPHAVHR